MYPLTALINLFIYVLQHPSLPSTESDISLMHQVTGHFSFLEYATTNLSFPFTREIANLARLAVMKAKNRENVNMENIASAVQTPPESAMDMGLLPLSGVRTLPPHPFCWRTESHLFDSPARSI
jgi:hypothetical protein